MGRRDCDCEAIPARGPGFPHLCGGRSSISVTISHGTARRRTMITCSSPRKGLLLTLPAAACIVVLVVAMRRRFRPETSTMTYWIRAGAVTGSCAIAGPSPSSSACRCRATPSCSSSSARSPCIARPKGDGPMTGRRCGSRKLRRALPVVASVARPACSTHLRPVREAGSSPARASVPPNDAPSHKPTQCAAGCVVP